MQREIIVGTLLGDGTMRCKANALLEIYHSVRQRDFVDWKYRHLSSLVATPPSARPGNGGRVAYRFVTRSLPELTPMVMAVWFMDDGSRSRNAVYLNTQQFDMRSQLRLIEQLQEQWGIDGSLNRDRTYHRIRLSVAGSVGFADLIVPHMLPMFMYKLPRVTP